MQNIQPIFFLTLKFDNSNDNSGNLPFLNHCFSISYRNKCGPTWTTISRGNRYISIKKIHVFEQRIHNRQSPKGIAIDGA